MSYLFISHNLAVVKYLSDAAEVFGNPKHPCTQALLAAIPLPEPPSDTRCKMLAPQPAQVGSVARVHWVECHLWT